MPPPTAAARAPAPAAANIQWDDADVKPSNLVSDIAELLSKRLLIDIVMKLPVVVIPVSSKSTSALVVDLGAFSVANELRVVRDVISDNNFPAVIDCTNFHWTNVSITR